MNHDVPGAGALDYHFCRYGASRLAFRGPLRPYGDRYAVCLGGSETFGKFVPRPWPEQLAALTGQDCLNLGCVNAGADAFLGDADVMALVRGAAVTVVQVMGAQNASNRYYTVHPRRNDRFVGPTPLLRTLLPEVDFTEFHFTRHLVTTLADRCPDQFGAVLAELQAVWLTRMRELLAQAGGLRIVLWMADQGPGDPQAALRGDPWGVDAALLDELQPDCDLILQVVPSPRARALGTAGMVFADGDAAAAQGLPGPACHEDTAAALAQVIRDRWPARSPERKRPPR